MAYFAEHELVRHLYTTSNERHRQSSNRNHVAALYAWVALEPMHVIIMSIRRLLDRKPKGQGEPGRRPTVHQRMTASEREQEQLAAIDFLLQHLRELRWRTDRLEALLRKHNIPFGHLQRVVWLIAPDPRD